MKKSMRPLLLFLAMILICIVGLIGWIMNIVNLTHLDFQSPYKAEVLRIAGIPVAPLGAVEGYLRIKN